MKKNKPPQRARGRRKFKSKLASSVDASLPVGVKPQAQLILESRKPLFKYLPDPTQWPPATFAEIANFNLRSQREFPPGLRKQLRWHEQLNATTYGDFNAVELSPELLRQAMSSNPSLALEQFRVVRRALARLYAVAWCGKGESSTAAKIALEQLLPTGKGHFTTRHLPELANRFLRLKREIVATAKRMQEQHPSYTEKKRNDLLVALYNEDSGVIYDALHKAEKAFVLERLAAVLDVPFPTVQVSLRRWQP